MATAIQKPRTARKAGAHATSASSSMRFLIFEDNAGNYHWTLVGGDRETLAQSPSFPSHEDAARAAERVLDGAGSARLERAPADRPVDAVGSPDAAPGRDSSDAARWSNEGGSVNDSEVGSLNGKVLRK